MKKIILSSLLVTNLLTFAYTGVDVSNAVVLSEKGIITKQSDETKYRLDDTITRAEVVKIALILKGVQNPSSYKCRGYFSDVRNNDWICRAVEIAADNGLVSRTNKKFRPQDKITKIEALAMLIKTTDITYPKYTGENLQYYHNTPQWQIDLLEGIAGMGIVPNGIDFGDNNHPQFALRNDVFLFTKNILDYQNSTTEQSGQFGGDRLEIENYNIMLYRKGEGDRRRLTQDGTPINPSSCLSPQEYNSYSNIGEANGVRIFQHSAGMCETDAGYSEYLIFNGTNLVSLEKLINTRLGITIGNGISASILVKNGTMKIYGEFNYNNICEDFGCPVYISKTLIKRLGVNVIQEPNSNSPGKFELIINVNDLIK